ncbi:MAG TPA: peptide-methionine (S)-S-oxide reductase MsrA [Steroidobacteraceae bacterium]|jgi:peptide-methionine (S)-S-oxide reductase|nr:peptide-methionine (S)-S-oxide reductase MsrA [Steroidobacteraceae bacterium]
MAIAKISAPLRLAAFVAAVAAGVVMWRTPLFGADAPVVIAPPTVDNPRASGPMQTAVLSGGCFWGVQGVFEHVRGVKNVIAGYAGGERATADYETVSSGTTGHAESVQITFDPAVISYGQLLQIAFSVVYDPTQLNRQGPDVGSQYRSEIFYSDDTQKRIAQAYIGQLDQSHAFARPIVTRVDRLKGFYPAENYHQDYLIHNPTQPYIAIYDIPKIQNFRRTFPQLYSGQPVLAHN